MRRLSSLLLAMLFISVGVLSAQQYNIGGRVIDNDSTPIPYATVILLQNSKQITGCTTDAQGSFIVTADSGEYEINISYIGYENHKQAISLTNNLKLEDIILNVTSEKIDEVVVTSQLIRREADRFVVDIANSPIAMGKDGEELLKTAPGVWIQDDKISINGSSGSKIYLNDREVKMEDAQLIAYLRSLRAEDIQKIEVIPQSGADYDASTSGGIIKISTKRHIDSGLMGSASFSTLYTKGYHNIAPSLSLNYNRGKLNAYGRAWLGKGSQDYGTEEHTEYTSGTIIDAKSDLLEGTYWGGGNFGIVYDINDKHSIGGEMQINNYGDSGTTDTWTNHNYMGQITRTEGAYNSNSNSKMVTATLNYIYKLDDYGSTIKLIGDYSKHSSPKHNDYFDTTSSALFKRDSTYRDNTISDYQLATATLSVEKIISPKLILKAGIKYTHNTNSNKADYEYLADPDNKIWQRNENNSYDIGYSENIGAAYATITARLGRLSLVGGLRGEYTHFNDKSGEVNQKYGDLFPNANLSYAITQDGAYSIVAQYSRTISRPSFWALSPNEIKISEYMIQRGNPELKASYNNSLSVTAVLKYKYTISAGIMLMENAIQQSTISDKENSELLILQYINYPTLNNYYASVNLPIQLTKWWATNLNFTAMYMGQRIYPDSPIRRNLMAVGNAQMSFTLPRNYFVEVDGMYMHGMVAGNTAINDMGNINLTLKKRLLKNKLTVSLGVQNIISTTQRITVKEADFERVIVIDQPWQRPSIRFQISYNFNSGKQFRAKSVESGSAEDRGRIGSGGNSAQ